jgi:hypothetical protein
MPPFPSTPELSTFDPPAENPLYEDGAWLQFNNQPPLKKTALGTVTDSIHGETNYSYYTRQMFSSNSVVEVWMCTDGGQLGAAVESWRIGLALNTGDGWNGYLVLFGGGIGSDYFIRRYDGGGFTNLITQNDGFPQRIGIRIDGSSIQAWGMYGGVWSMRTSIADTTYRGFFHAFIGIEDPTGGGLSSSCFGAGYINRTQIYRIIRGRSLPLTA